MFEKTPEYPPLPPDDPKRNLTIAQPDTDQSLPHIGVVGDTYTITVSGDETNGRFCVIDMHIPPGGGPGPHRHDFEETFILLEGEVEATFRGKKSIVKAGDTINIPSNCLLYTSFAPKGGCSSDRRSRVARSVMIGRKRRSQENRNNCKRALRGESATD